MWESFLPGTPKHGWFLTSFEISVTYVQDTRLSSSLASSAIITLDGPSLHGIVPVPGFENCDHWPSNASFRSMTLFHVFSIGITSRLMSHPCRWCSSCLIPQVPGVRRAQLDSTDMNALKNGHSVPFNQLLGSPGKLGCAHILTAPAKNWGGRIIRMRRRLPNPWVKLSD